MNWLHSLSFCLLPSFAPNVDTMASHQNSCWTRIFSHRLIHSIFQIFFKRCILDNWHNQFFVVTQVTAQCMIVDALKDRNNENRIESRFVRHYTMPNGTQTFIISKCVHRNSLPGHNNVAITAFGECVWITAPAFRWRYGNINNGVHWLFFNLQFKKTAKDVRTENTSDFIKIHLRSLTFCIPAVLECHLPRYFE